MPWKRGVGMRRRACAPSSTPRRRCRTLRRTMMHLSLSPCPPPSPVINELRGTTTSIIVVPLPLLLCPCLHFVPLFLCCPFAGSIGSDVALGVRVVIIIIGRWWCGGWDVGSDTGRWAVVVVRWRGSGAGGREGRWHGGGGSQDGAVVMAATAAGCSWWRGGLGSCGCWRARPGLAQMWALTGALDDGGGV